MYHGEVWQQLESSPPPPGTRLTFSYKLSENDKRYPRSLLDGTAVIIRPELAKAWRRYRRGRNYTTFDGTLQSYELRT